MVSFGHDLELNYEKKFICLVDFDVCVCTHMWPIQGLVKARIGFRLFQVLGLCESVCKIQIWYRQINQNY